MSTDILDFPGAGGQVPIPGGGPAHRLAFLQAIFGSEFNQAFVTSFPGDPHKGGNREWAGGLFIDLYPMMKETHNQYVVVSLFRKEEGQVVRRTADTFVRCLALMIDDVGPGQKVPIDELPDHGESATAVVETSKDNFQLWYALSEEVEPHRIDWLHEQIAMRYAAGGRDPGMKSITRYGRLPAGINGKPSANNWHVVMTAFRPNRKFTFNELVVLFGLDDKGVEDIEPPVEHRLSIGDDKLEQVEDIRMSFVAATRAAGLDPTPRASDPDKFDLTCPWVEDHTRRVRSGTIMKLPSAESPTYYFKCHHGHCESRRMGELIAFLAERVPDVPVLSPNTLEFDPVDEAQVERDIKPSEPVVTKLRTSIFQSARSLGLSTRGTPPVPVVSVLGVPAGSVSILAGPPGIGKSYLTLQLAISIAAGVPLFGTFDVLPGRVLMVLGEDRVGRDSPMHDRVYGLLQSMMLDDEQVRKVLDNLFFASVSLPREIAREIAERRPNLDIDSDGRVTDAMVQQVREEYRIVLQTLKKGEVVHPAGPWMLLRREVREHRPRILFLDPKAALDLSNENDNAHQASFMYRLDEFAEQHDVTIILIHHTTKAAISAEELSQELVRGASAITGGARHVMALVPMSAKVAKALQYDEVSQSRRLLLEVVKANYVRRTRHVLRYEYGEAMSLDMRRYEMDLPPETATPAQRIYHATLKNRGALPTSRELQDLLKVRRQAITQATNELLAAKVLVGPVNARVLADDHAERFAAINDDILAL
jgi:hypothetical protein